MKMSLCRMVVVLALTGLLVACGGKATQGQQASPEPTKPPVSLSQKLFGWTSFLGKIFPKKSKPPVAVPPQLLGQIRQVNLENQFVLIDASISNAAEPGDALVSIADQKETAILRLSSLRSSTFLIADIASGTPSVGDRVYKR